MVEWNRAKLVNGAVVGASIIAIFDGLLGLAPLGNILLYALWSFVASLVFSTLAFLMDSFLDLSGIDKDQLDDRFMGRSVLYLSVAGTGLFVFALAWVFAYLSAIAVLVYLLTFMFGAFLFMRFDKKLRALVRQREDTDNDQQGGSEEEEEEGEEADRDDDDDREEDDD